MKSLIAAAAALFTLLSAGCTIPPPNQPAEQPEGSVGGVDWFGNPPPGEDLPHQCSVPEGIHLDGSVLDRARDKPLSTPPLNNWVNYGLQVKALDASMHNDLCVPIHVTYKKRVLDPDLVINGVSPEGVTYDFWTTSPWQGYVYLDYDPTDERMAGRPPTYQIDLEASYVPVADDLNAGKPIALGCYIQIIGAPAAGGLSPSGLGCEAHLTNNYFNLA